MVSVLTTKGNTPKQPRTKEWRNQKWANRVLLRYIRRGKLLDDIGDLKLD